MAWIHMIDWTPGPLWLAAGVALLVIEVLAPGAFMMWLGLAALGTGLLAHFQNPAFPWQVACFALLAAVGIVVGLRLRRRGLPSGLNTPESGLIGRSARVLSFAGREGRVRLGDSDWSARLATAEAAPATGTTLRVVGVDGSVLLVADQSLIDAPSVG